MHSLSRQLLVWFVALALVPLAVATVLTYLAAERALRHEVTNGLYAIARRQATQLASYTAGRERDLTALARMPGTLEAMRELADTLGPAGEPRADHAAVDQRHRPLLSYYPQALGYEDLYLVRPDGRVVFSAGHPEMAGANLRAVPHRGTGLGHSFDRARTLLDLDRSDFEPYGESGRITAFLAAPLLDDNAVDDNAVDDDAVDSATLVGVAIVRVSDREIRRVLSDHTGLGDSGETLLDRRIGDDALIVTPLRNAPDPPFTRHVAIGSAHGLPTQLAVQGQRGEGLSVDYAGQPVLAVWRYVPALGAGMVVKVSTAEAFAPIGHLKGLAILLVAATALVVAFAALWVARSIADPVVELTHVTSHIAAGDLGRRVDVRSHNEVGQLARSFNRMTDELARSIEELRMTTAAKERIESELRVAHEIQMGILPKIFPPFPHRPEFDLHALLEPAKEVGGDFYDFLLFDDAELHFVIGDVSGKGVPASLFMAITLTLFRSAVTQGMEPATLLAKLNSDLCADNPSALFVTVFCGKLDIRTGEVTFANGGHNAPYHLQAQGGVVALPLFRDLVLGAFEGSTYQQGRVALQPGDSLLLFTDGVTEAMNAREELFGEARLQEILAASRGGGPQEVVSAVAGDVRIFVGSAPQADDLTMLVLRYRGQSGPA